MSAYSRTNYPYARGRSDYQPLGAGEKFPFEIDAKGTDYPIGSPGDFQLRYCRPLRRFPTDRPIMAGTFSVFPIAWFRERCSAPRPLTKNFPKESYHHRKCYLAYNTSGCYPLEYSQYGKNSRGQQCNCSTNMERTPSKASSNQNVQTQQGQTLYRETLRRCWALSQPARQ